MNFFKEWLQDWTDACVYAKECWPDFPFMHWREPYSAIATVFAGCFLLWAFNEWRVVKRRPLPAKKGGALTTTRELTAIVEQMKSAPPAKKLAA